MQDVVGFTRRKYRFLRAGWITAGFTVGYILGNTTLL